MELVRENLKKNYPIFIFGIFLIVISIVLLLAENLKQFISFGTMILGIILVSASILKPKKSTNPKSTSDNNETKNTAKNATNIIWGETDSQTLIERFDSKNSTQITAFVAIIFGAFTILTFLEGKGLPPTEVSVWFLVIIESVIFPLAVYYCLVRSFFYSWCAEKVKAKTNLHRMEDIVSDEAIEDLPSIIKKMANYRRHMKNSTIMYYVLPIVWLIWIGIIIAVLNFQ